MNTKDKVQQLRELMRAESLDYYYVPSTDPHHNEYLPACWQRRAWLTGFTGSAGEALVGLGAAYLWTDSRYCLQAEAELDLDVFSLMRQQNGMTPSMIEWLGQQKSGVRIGVDPKLMSVGQAKRWQAALAKINGELIFIEANLVDAIWDDQPHLETRAIQILDEQYAGKSAGDKIAAAQQQLKKLTADAHVLNLLDAIAWLLNIRGRDVEFNPLVLSYAIIEKNSVSLFLDLNRVDANLKKYLTEIKVKVFSYEAFADKLKALNSTVLLEPNTANAWIAEQLNQTELLLADSPITLLKAVKNTLEVEGMFEAHRRDAIAMVKFFYWLENNWQTQTELSAAEKIDALRALDPKFQGLSFATISGYGNHGAIVHYRVTPSTAAPLGNNSIYLVDSGGQYLTGTTDITRCLHFGNPTKMQRYHYTLVLKGHLALRHTQFPFGTCGEHLNALAHHPLWQAGVDFGHGTGHGVGCYLCVHEGPQRISSGNSQVPLEVGMVVSNEPGIYLQNQYGVRIENCCVVTKALESTDSPTGHGPFLGFKDLTMVPYARNLIDHETLTGAELKWINQYHNEIFELLRDDLATPEREWLANATKPLVS